MPPVAAEVHGRLLEALEGSGQHASARGEATRYLEQFPNGPYATLAKKILAPHQNMTSITKKGRMDQVSSSFVEPSICVARGCLPR